MTAEEAHDRMRRMGNDGRIAPETEGDDEAESVCRRADRIQP